MVPTSLGGNRLLVVAAVTLLGTYGGFSWWTSTKSVDKIAISDPADKIPDDDSRQPSADVEIGVSDSKLKANEMTPKAITLSSKSSKPMTLAVKPSNSMTPATKFPVKSAKATVKPAKKLPTWKTFKDCVAKKVGTLTAVGGFLGGAAVAATYVAGTLIKQSQKVEQQNLKKFNAERAGKIITNMGVGVAGIGVAVKAGLAVNRLPIPCVRRRWLERLRTDPNTLLFEHAPEYLRNDREAVLIAVTRFGLNIRFASEELRNDREIVAIAVRNHWVALPLYASPQLQDILRDDVDLVLHCIRTQSNGGHILKEVSPRLRNNPEVVRAATCQNATYIKDASEELRGNREFIQEFCNRHHARILGYDSGNLGDFFTNFHITVPRSEITMPVRSVA